MSRGARIVWTEGMFLHTQHFQQHDRWAEELARLRYPNRNEAWREKLPADVSARIERLQLGDLRRLGHVG